MHMTDHCRPNRRVRVGPSPSPNLTSAPPRPSSTFIMPGLSRHHLSPVRTFPFAPSNHILPSHPLHPIIPETQLIIWPIISLFDVAINGLPICTTHWARLAPQSQYGSFTIWLSCHMVYPFNWASGWVSGVFGPQPTCAFFQVNHQVLQQFASMSGDESGWQLMELDPGVFMCACLLPNKLMLLENWLCMCVHKNPLPPCTNHNGHTKILSLGMFNSKLLQLLGTPFK